MKVKQPFKIRGAGVYFPKSHISSEDLETTLQIPAGWSVKNSGVKSRYHSSGETGAFMGARAFEEALKHSGLRLGEIDLLIVGSATYDQPIPNRSSLLKAEINGASDFDFPCVDLDTTCLSFVTALEFASAKLDGEDICTIAIVSSEISSKGINPKDWETATLFGDAAAAVIISHDHTGSSGLIKSKMITCSEGVHHTVIQGGGNTYFFKDHPYDEQLHSFKMSGKELLRMAKQRIPVYMSEFFSNLSISIEDVDWIIPHQASRLGLELFKRMYKFRPLQVMTNLETHGNCISASIAVLFCEAIISKRLQSGQTCFLCGTSAGFSIGGVLIKI